MTDQSHIHDALFEQGAQRIEELRATRDELRRVLQEMLSAFCDPITRRALGGHNERQQCAVLEARETLRRPL